MILHINGGYIDIQHIIGINLIDSPVSRKMVDGDRVEIILHDGSDRQVIYRQEWFDQWVKVCGPIIKEDDF